MLLQWLKRRRLAKSSAIAVLEFSGSGKCGARAYSLVVCRRDAALELAARYYSLFPHYHGAKFRRTKQRLIRTFPERLEKVRGYIDFLVVSHDKQEVVDILFHIAKLYRSVEVVADPVFRKALSGWRFRVEDKKREPAHVRALINIADNAANWFRVAGTTWLIRALTVSLA